MNRGTIPLVAAALLLGGVIGWWIRGEAPTAAPAVEPSVSPPATTAARPDAPAANAATAQPGRSASEIVRLSVALAQSQKTTEELRVQLEAAMNPPPRPRIPFPANAPPEAKDPAAFRAVAERALAECSPGVTLEAVDCTEYPCIAFARDRAPRPDPSRVPLWKCQPWKDVFGEKTTMSARRIVGADGGMQRFVAFYPYPSDAASERLSGYFESLGRNP